MLVIEALNSRFQTMADGSGRLQFDTQILKPEEFLEVGKISKKTGILVFKSGVDELTEKEMEAIEQVKIPKGLGDRKKKSKSQLLRQILFRNFEQDPEGFDTQQEHYDHYMDTIIEHFKSKLE